jgi:hypothetical protein
MLTLGASYMKIDPQGSVDAADVYDVRASWSVLPGLTLAGEYAYEESNDFDGSGYYAQVLYEFGEVAWKPSFTYRYARFDEDFSPLAYGFTANGYWYQGETAGNYPLSNNNLKSNMLRVKLEPHEGIGVNLIYYSFKLTDPAAFGVSSDDFGDEVDLSFDWQATERISLLAVLAVLRPGDAAEQWTGGHQDWKYGLMYVSFTL